MRIWPALVVFLLAVQPCLADGPGVTAGPPEQVYGPSNRFPDSPVFTLNTKMYIANGSTFIFDDFEHPVIGAGTELLSFDHCGAWLMSAYQDPSASSGQAGIVRGWYHAEAIIPPYHCARKTIAYAESYDGGLTFVKPGYPDNQIITAPPIPDIYFDDEGDFHVTRNGDYFYLYFLASRDIQIHLARSLVSDGGRPGTWYKWYQGGFTEPGLGGRSDPIAGRWELQFGWVSQNSYLNKWMGFAHRSDGWGLSVSDDGQNFTPFNCTIIPAGLQAGGRGEEGKSWVDYLSIVGLDGSSEQAGQSFWVYYMYIAPYDGPDRRYLLRRRVTLDGSGGCTVVPARLPVWLPVVGK